MLDKMHCVNLLRTAMWRDENDTLDRRVSISTSQATNQRKGCIHGDRRTQVNSELRM